MAGPCSSGTKTTWWPSQPSSAKNIFVGNDPEQAKLSKNHRDLSCGWPWIFWGSARLTPRLLPNHATYLDNLAGAQYLNTSEKIFCHLRRIASVRYQTKPLAKAIFRGLRNCKLSNHLNICMYTTWVCDDFVELKACWASAVAWITTRLSTWRMCIRAMRSYIEIDL